MKQTDIKIRRSWDRKPQTQVKQSDKIYNRKREDAKERKIMRDLKEVFQGLGGI